MSNRQKSSASRRVHECWTIPAQESILVLRFIKVEVRHDVFFFFSDHLQQLSVDQLLWTSRSFHELLAQHRRFHLPLLLVDKLEKKAEGINVRIKNVFLIINIMWTHV